MKGVSEMLKTVCAMTAAVALAGCATMSSVDPGDAVLRVGTSADYPPVVFVDGDDILGIEADFAAMAGTHLGRQVEFVRLPFKDLIDSLLAGDIDVIMSGMTRTPERAERVAFTAPYMTVSLTALIRAADAGQFREDHDVKKAAVRMAAQPGTTAAEYLRVYCFAATAKSAMDPIAAPAALLAGDIDLFLHDSPTIEWLLSGHDETLTAVHVDLMRQDLAWAVRPGDRPLLRALNRMIKNARKDGSLETPLSRWVPRAMARQEAAKAAGLAKTGLFLKFEGPEAMVGETMDVLVDGELIRQWEIKEDVWFTVFLQPGIRQIRLVAEGAVPVERTVVLSEANPVWQTFTLRPAVAEEK